MADSQDSRTVTLHTSEQVSDTPMMGCRACGAMQPAGFRFCRVCGAPFTRGDLPAGFVDPLVGAIVGERYRIVARIGAGGMGAVYRVEHVQLGKEAAIKLLHGELSRDQTMVRRFNREARAVSRLSSPHTVSVFDYGRSAGLVYLVMELLAGRDLSKVLQAEGRLSPERVAAIVGQVAHSLAEAHALGIVHRDLKPQNIFLLESKRGEGDRVKVLDFGLAKLAEVRDESLSMDETQAGVVMGTPHYMSPEQIRDAAIDSRADVYGLGAVVFRLLTGVPPFQHKTPLGVLHMHLTAEVPSMGERDASLSSLDGVIRRAMAKRPEDRYQSVGAFADDLIDASTSSAGRQFALSGSTPDGAEGEGRAGTRLEFEVFERRLRLRRAFGAFAAVVATAVLALGAWAAATGVLRPKRTAESEPNDELDSATRVVAGVHVRGTSVPSGTGGRDTDAFRLSRSGRGPVLVVRVVPEVGVDVAIEVVDAAGQVLVRADSSGAGGPEFVPGVRFDGEEVFVLVRGVPTGTGAAGYVMETHFRPELTDEEHEPNDRVPQALVGPVVGAIGWQGDEDRYWLEGASAGGVFEVAVSAVPGVDLRVTLTDHQQTRSLVLDDAGVGRAERVRFEVAPSDFVGRPILTVSAPDGSSSPLVYRLETRLVRSRPPEGSGR